MKQTEIPPKRQYASPKLVEYGDLHKLTRNGQNGSGDGENNGHPGQTKPCWIAEVLYGKDDPRTQLLRSWLGEVYGQTGVGRMIVAAYRAFGRGIAALARRSQMLRRVLRPLFDRGLRRAQAHYMSAAA